MKALEIWRYFSPGNPDPIFLPSSSMIGMTPLVEFVTQISSADRKESTVIFVSSYSKEVSWISSKITFLVTPGRIFSVKGGVKILLSIQQKTLLTAPSVMNPFSKRIVSKTSWFLASDL